jgi:hypothetical protein
MVHHRRASKPRDPPDHHALQSLVDRAEMVGPDAGRGIDKPLILLEEIIGRA